MYEEGNVLKAVSTASHKFDKEKDYWLIKLGGELVKTGFPFDVTEADREEEPGAGFMEFDLSGELFSRIVKISNGYEYTMHMVLTAVAMLLLGRYTGSKDIIVGMPVYREETEDQLLNTVLALRSSLEADMTFKEFLMQVRQTIIEADEHQNYPVETLMHHLGLSAAPGQDFPLFDTAVLLESIHDRAYLRDIRLNMIFTFSLKEDALTCTVEYNAARFHTDTIGRITGQFIRVLDRALENIDARVLEIDVLSDQERERVLYEFNVSSDDSDAGFPQTIVRLFEQQADRTPDRIAVSGRSAGTGNHALKLTYLSYRQLDIRANQVARVLRDKGVNRGHTVALMLERSPALAVAVLGILKAGAAYLPLDAEAPENVLLTVLADSRASVLLTQEAIQQEHSFTALQGLWDLDTDTAAFPVHVTPARAQISNLDDLPFPDRSLINYEAYNNNIGQAMVKNAITLQATRGCPFNCAYCHKIWPKKHYFRSAENILEEINIYYRMGVKRFAFVDDIFNFNRENSRRFFELILKNRMELQLFFPSGLRTDILRPEDIDLMVEAGTVSFALALETASPRLQKLIGKHLDLEKFRENIEYICEKHPGIISELFTMHGFPSESEEEALMTLNFIKSLRWVHFPYINILKIYPGTDMVRLALENGISLQSIIRSEEQYHHEFSDSLPFTRSFTLNYQSEFLKEYFLDKERLLNVLPYQMQVLSEEEMVLKYNSYFPDNIDSFEFLLDTLGIDGADRQQLQQQQFESRCSLPTPELNRQLAARFPRKKPGKHAFRILLLDLSMPFSTRQVRQYDVYEPPLGLMNILTYLNRQQGDRVEGKIAKSRIDFDSFDELKELVESFKPQLIGIRTLILFKDFFHRTVGFLRKLGKDAPIITGGPYATSSYRSILQDSGIDLVVLGEGEITFDRLIGEILANNGQLPGPEILKQIPGLAFRESGINRGRLARQVLMMDNRDRVSTAMEPGRLQHINQPGDPAYIIYTSGTTGKSKGVMVEHRNVHYLLDGLREGIYKEFPGNLHVAMVSPYVFDASVKQIFLALLQGHALYIVPEEVRVDGAGLIEYYQTNQIDISDGTPTHLRILLASMPGTLAGLPVKRFIIGGEALSRQTALDFLQAFKAEIGKTNREIPRIINAYGPTECCVDAVLYEVTPASALCHQRIPIGSPMKGAQIYILSPQGQLQPVGAAGEICISGGGVGRGYLNTAGLTFERFINYKIQNTNYKQNTKYKLQITSPWEQTTTGSKSANKKFLRGVQGGGFYKKSPPGRRRQRYYKTGDRGRWLVDGNIEYLGRSDHQVKIRGFRIELAEIENRLLSYPGIKEAVVLVKGDQTDDRYLCAYFVSGAETPVIHEIRDYLAGYLHAYMIPSRFVQLTEMPLTVNGKVDRRALPDDSTGDMGIAYAAPRDETEKKLVNIWSEILKIEPDNIGIDSDFFKLGGHSLRATILISKIHKTFDVRIPLKEIFKAPFIRAVAAYLKTGAPQEQFSAIPLAPVKSDYELSSAQKRLYFLQQMDPESDCYNLLIPAVLEGELEKERLEGVFRQLMQRHENLRTSFELVDNQLRQKIQEQVEFSLEYCELGEEAIGDFIKDAYTSAFDLSQSPLFRVGLIRVDAQRHVMVVNLHHIICDGTSLGILMRDFMKLYDGEELAPLPLQYKDYSEWQNSGRQRESLKKQREYWLRQFAGEVPRLDLPMDFPRPGVQSFEGKRILFHIDDTRTGKILRLLSERDVTMYMFFLSVYSVFLGNLAGREDIVVGSPLANRQHADLEQVVGIFINMLLMRCQPVGQKTFADFLREVKQVALAAFENQDYMFEDLVEELMGGQRQDPSRNPLFNVFISVQNMEIPEMHIGSLRLSTLPLYGEVSRFDMGFILQQVGDRIHFWVEYCTRLFKEETIKMFVDIFNQVVDAVLENPEIRLSDIEISSRFTAAQTELPELDLGF